MVVQDEMIHMAPPIVPARETMVYLTSVLEIVGAIGLLGA